VSEAQVGTQASSITTRIVEAGDTRQIMSAPHEPYTRALIEAVPRL